MTSNEGFSVLVCTAGTGMLSAGGRERALHYGSRILLPYGLREFTLTGSSLEVVLIMPPEL